VTVNDIGELGTILSVWAHPDDEAYLCGGIMAMATAAGSRVVCVTATRGELGVTDPERWPPEELPAIREAELAECLRILGVSEHHWLGYPDGGCAAIALADGAARIATIVEAVRPDTVLTFAPDGQTGHPDHIAVHYWTAEAVRRTGLGALHVVANPQDWMDEFLPRMLELNVLMGEPPLPWTGPLSIEARLAEEVLGQKLRALAAQASQTDMLRAAVGDDYYRRIFATERFRVQPL
jgi:LmbE family N-acetylglucosaminyl deacetylase